MTDEILSRKEEFKEWMKTLIKEEDSSTYGETQINAYCYSLEQASSKLKVSTPLVQSNVFSYDNLKTFNRAYALIVGASNYSKVDMATGNRTFSTALLHYSNFLKATAKNGKKSQRKANFIKYFNSIITVLSELNAKATPKEVREAIIFKYNISEMELSYVNGNLANSNGANKFITEVNFAGNYLAKAGLIEITEDNLWSLTDEGKEVKINSTVALDIFKQGLAKNREETERSIKKHWIYPIEKMYKQDSVYVSDEGLQTSNWAEFKESNIITIPFGELGDLRGYTNKEDIKAVLKECFGNTSKYSKTTLLVWQYVNELQVGDIIIVQEGSKILGRGIIVSDYGFDENRDDNYNHTREVKWTNLGEWEIATPKLVNTITDASKYLGYLECTDKIFDDTIVELEEPITKYESYIKTEFLNEVYMKEYDYTRLVTLLKAKKNVILQGPAGVGKTFIAKRLAYSLLGEKNLERVKTIQFHQSYTYEDFLMGYRPVPTGLELQYGVFYKFCKKAELDKENDYYFIIDEINRGNLSKIFGELFMLVENDKRGEEIQLTYTNELFSIPPNVYIIGMMNTSDRGLAMLDYALRRRFGFYELEPAFESLGFMSYQAKKNSPKFNKLILEIKVLNKEIEYDENLGKGLAVGHSYFANESEEITDEWLHQLVDFELMALLNEYWFDEPSKVKEWKKRLNEAITT